MSDLLLPEGSNELETGSDDGPFVFPASFGQQRLWILDRLEPGSAAYNIAIAFRLDGELEPTALRRAFQEIVRRHESLRTTFKSEGGRTVQVVSQDLDLDIPVIELAHADHSKALHHSGPLANA